MNLHWPKAPAAFVDEEKILAELSAKVRTGLLSGLRENGTLSERSASLSADEMGLRVVASKLQPDEARGGFLRSVKPYRLEFVSHAGLSSGGFNCQEQSGIEKIARRIGLHPANSGQRVGEIRHAGQFKTLSDLAQTVARAVGRTHFDPSAIDLSGGVIRR